MKMKFRGRLREVYPHNYVVTPGRHGSAKAGDPLVWDSSTTAHGRIDDVGLNGNFHVQFDFDEAELRNWLSVYVAEQPTEALRMLSEMQVAAIIALSDYPKSTGDNDQLTTQCAPTARQ